MLKIGQFIMIAAGLMFSPAFAGESINSHLFRFSDSFETVTLEDAMGPNSEFIQSKNRAMLRFSYDYVHEPLIAVDEARRVQIYDIVERLQTISIGGGYLFFPRVWIGFTLPVHEVVLGNPFATTDPKTWALGDVELKSKIRISPDHSKINIALEPYVAFPTGNENYLVTDNSYAYGVKILGDQHWKRFSLFANAGFISASHAEFLNIDRSHRIEFGSGTLIKFYQNPANTKSFGVNVEANWGLTVSGIGDSKLL